ncbi:MAG: beta-aspartyl-peptidase [Xanthomonadales bacterium]|nr:beta-aspartyl-peptidase [Xanthomonadales bacterium]NNL96224.1 beta-aspartyl-peptidase [Xanthomonadales bacterium]
MLTLLENANIFSPEACGTGFVLTGGGSILYVGAKRPEIDRDVLTESVDLQGAYLVPGFVDAHVHSTGGGGEGGFSTQVPAVPVSQFTRHGVTTVVGLLGCDDETRNMANLLARTRALCEEGLSAWCWTGGYHVPPVTLTGSVRSDIVHIDRVLGLGEIAISDHRSSQPSQDELARLASEVHVGGMLSGKAGVMHLHLGDGARGLEPVRQLLAGTELPPRMFHPTHVNRQKRLFEEACELANRGVTIDLTAVEPIHEDEWSAEDAWEQFMDQGCPPQRITVSSDGGGCIPQFDEHGGLQGMDVGSSETLPRWLAELQRRGHALELLLPAITSNVASLLKLKAKGRIATGMDADLLCLGADMAPLHVMARGRWMVRDGKVTRRGRFEG